MKGVCLCESVTIETGDANEFEACHCDMCRRRGGGPFLTVHCGSNVAQSDAYGIPLGHLLDFYGKVGYRHVQPETAPAFLAERLDSYLQEGKDVALMFRPATS
jgi:hypothetical protein